MALARWLLTSIPIIPAVFLDHGLDVTASSVYQAAMRFLTKVEKFKPKNLLTQN
jgi:hypothetical protein